MATSTNVGVEVDWATTHETLRDALLKQIVTTLQTDERFVAAWLVGSFGRGEEDAFSDLDLIAVVAPTHDAVLCARPWQSAGRTTPERLALVRTWGTPVVVHDVHRNAPEGGTHTNVIYDSGLEFDLNLVPQALAHRPVESRLLFDALGVPVEPAPEAEPLERRGERIGQQVALFWVMIMVASKYRLRRWDVNVHLVLDMLYGQVATVRRLIEGEPPRFQRYAPGIALATTPEAQASAIRAVSEQMEALLPEARRLCGDVPQAPQAVFERWLRAAPPKGVCG